MRQVSAEKEERELLRWKRNKTGRRKKKRESPMNILEKIQARASEMVGRKKKGRRAFQRGKKNKGELQKRERGKSERN